MGAFFIANKQTCGAAIDKLDRAHRDCGFAPARQIDLGAFSLHLYCKLDGQGGLSIDLHGGGFACLAGQLLYRGATGEEALRLYCADLAGDRLDTSRLIGQFAVVLKDAAGTRVLTDPMSFYQVYLDAAGGAVSSSFWALLELLPQITVDAAGVYEYAWNGATFGGKTFVREIRRLPAGAEITLDGALGVSAASPPRQGTPTTASFDDLVTEHAERVRRLFGDLAAAYGEHLRVSFSSGYDSRLILAGLKAAGLRPRLFVYGQNGNTDVEIAKQVAAGEGLSLDVIDKNQLADAAADTAARQESDFVRFDAWKVDGIFDDGVDARDRLARHADGGVPLNGSLGEIYRNFFYIPDRPMALREVAESFFSGYAPAACSPAFREADYHDGLVRAFQQELGSDGTRVSRAQVESLYPLVRGRYWTGRDVNLNLRFGRMFFPFMQGQLIEGTAEIPIAFKNHGRLEAKIIERLDPALAAYPSGYGYRFCDAPPLKHRAKTWATLLRPPWLRRYSYRLRFAKPQAMPPYLAESHLAPLIDASLPYMQRYFRPERLYDEDAFNRVATMEYIFQRYGAVE